MVDPFCVKEKENRTPLLIEVAVALPVFGYFTYKVPEKWRSRTRVGTRTILPFKGRRVTGYILGEGNAPKGIKIRSIDRILDERPLFPVSMVPFFKWISEYYAYPPGEVIKTALPTGLVRLEKKIFKVTDKGRRSVGSDELEGVEKEILCIVDSGCNDLRGLRRKIQTDRLASLLRKLERRGLLESTPLLARAKTGEKCRKLLRLAVVPKRYATTSSGLSRAGLEMLFALAMRGPATIKELSSRIPSAARLRRSIEEKGLVETFSVRIFRDPLGEVIEKDTRYVHTVEQKEVIKKIKEGLTSGFSCFLLSGVTGSGKTEVYLALVEEAVKRRGSALVLVPEIALVSQMARAFRARFKEMVGVVHSGLSPGERLDQWSRMADGSIRIAIGVRSAVFAPLSDIRIIIVDEEHDTAYKQDAGLRYNARDLAVMRGKQLGCKVLLGSATPSVVSCFNAETGKYKKLVMKRRILERSLPEVRLVDLRRTSHERGMKRFFTPELLDGIRKTLERKEQVLLFINRRGFSSHAVCGGCGSAVLCENCDISLTYHKKEGLYRCHYCGFSRHADKTCGICGFPAIFHLGMGSERVEAHVKKLFPSAVVVRMDSDTTAKKGKLLSILKGLKENRIDVLVGTQMVAKGHDFPNITLVGVICADLTMNFPDFRAGERTFQLLAQVAGRAGRGDKPGRVMIQTYNPDHFCIRAAMAQDFEEFYKKEIKQRQTLGYPPFSRMVQLIISGRDRDRVREAAEKTADFSRLMLYEENALDSDVLGPVQAPIGRIGGDYRWQVLVKSPRAGPIIRLTRSLVSGKRLRLENVRLAVDMDPVSML